MCEDPIDGESVTLVVTAESEDAVSALETAIEATGATVQTRLQFGALRVEIEQKGIDDLCALDGIESIETANTVGVGGDAGEDVGGE